jgi:hypothetical protein
MQPRFRSVTFPGLAHRIGFSTGPVFGPEYEVAMAKELISLPDAMASLPVKVSRTTGWRWLLRYPALGLQIGGRHYLRRECLDAIASGTPLAEAAKIGVA